ncbi:MAG: hypothetical protein LBK43_08710 [Treponema sp.]|nr:hypothetical protein [Treponema sp.]
MDLGVFRKVRLASLSVLLGALLFGACNQDPIFYGISLEVEPVDPRIVGMPSNIVAAAGKVYVASKFNESIHVYEGTGWQRIRGPGGQILELAATTNQVYALTGKPGSSSLYTLDTSATNVDWKPVTSTYKNIQSIYGAKDTLFACAMIDTSTFVMLWDVDETLQKLTGGSGFLYGAVNHGSDYYLATGTGIYTRNGETLTLVSGSGTEPVIGLITLKDMVVGVRRDGTLLYGDSSSFTQVKESGVTFTGAIAAWKKDNEETDALLLLGIQGGSTAATHGYREILLSDGSLLSTDLGLRTPGKAEPSSVSDYDKYYSSIGKHPIVNLYQAPDGILFAGTTKNGLWSYRNDQWNAEP